jgi:hypothetical protein
MQMFCDWAFKVKVTKSVDDDQVGYVPHPHNSGLKTSTETDTLIGSTTRKRTGQSPRQT